MSSPLAQALIHPAPPPEPGWWPPAPGWWLVAGLLVVMLLLIPVGWARYQQLQQRRRRAVRILGAINHELPTHEWVAALNTLIKRWLKTHGDPQALQLHGQQWLDFLCSRYPKPRAEILAPLGQGAYDPSCQLDSAQRQRLLFELQRWLRHNHA